MALPEGEGILLRAYAPRSYAMPCKSEKRGVDTIGSNPVL